jgi:hypothetical protein
LAQFDTAWDEGELLRGFAVLKHLCGAVNRLKALISKIEAKNKVTSLNRSKTSALTQKHLR